MECTHKLSFGEIMKLEQKHLNPGQPVIYTCPTCSQPCELELNTELKALALAVTGLIAVIVAALILPIPLKGYLALIGAVLKVALCVAAVAGSYTGMMYLYFRLNRFRFTANEYHSIINGRKSSVKK